MLIGFGSGCVSSGLLVPDLQPFFRLAGLRALPSQLRSFGLRVEIRGGGGSRGRSSRAPSQGECPELADVRDRSLRFHHAECIGSYGEGQGGVGRV